MTRKLIATAVAALLATAALGGGIALAGGEDQAEGPDIPITGTDLEQATAAALAHMGGGEVTGTEVGDEESYYEVEVTVDGRQVDVQLDEAFTIVSEEVESTPDDG